MTSGQRGSNPKSKIYVSRNVNQDLKERLQNVSGFPVIEDLRVYLGMHILKKWMTHVDAGPFLDKWRMKCLSLVGQITLTKIVLTSLLVYTMITVPLPFMTCKRIDQIAGALYGATLRKEDVCIMLLENTKLNDLGGLGIKTMMDLNYAMLDKLGWRFLREDGSLRVEILKKKNISGPTLTL
ncbi:LOW QUALITY PROTEIN: hypothetical protein V2J09_010525 [Rumex salicifolius]